MLLEERGWIVVGVDLVWSARLSDAKLYSDTYTQNHIPTLKHSSKLELDSNMVVLYIGQLANIIRTWKENTGWPTQYESRRARNLQVHTDNESCRASLRFPGSPSCPCCP